jgi:glycogen operon protein
MRLAGDLIGDVDERGEPVVDDTALILVNAHHEPIPFTLPETLGGQVWQCVLDTYKPEGEQRVMRGGEQFDLRDRSLAVLFTREEAEASQPASRAEVETLRREAHRPTPPVPRHNASTRET